MGDYAALSANSIGSQWGNGQNPVMQTLAHAAVGAGAAHLTGGDAAARAIGGVVEAGLDNTVGAYLRESGTELDQWGRLAYLAGATLAGGIAAEAAGHDGATGAQAAQNSAQNNFLNHQQMQDLAKELGQCEANGNCPEVVQEYFEKHQINEQALQQACDGSNTSACQATALEIYDAVLNWQRLDYHVELQGQAAEILQAFHMLNLAAQSTATAGVAMPSAKAFVEALGMDPENAAGLALVGTIASIAAGKAAAAKGAGTAFKDFNQARNAAVQWLEGRGFRAEQETLGRFGGNAGQPIGMKSADGKSGFRVEFDERHGAHINVWSGKQKDTFTFEGNQSMVDQIVKQFAKERP